MKRFTYAPTDDLTVQELSDIFKVTVVALIEGLSGQVQTGSDALEFEEPIYDSFPDDVKKHFTETKVD
ncbi:hypothetical protein LCGC14_1737630 [marine sediment metagenome]|uniref:Uncharacterized protein n=1 Tax=marine sediment metagenome TaxID=412755 RepID=A0A0F9H7K2_9ZZZZ